ncbi:hypothetical protein Pmani_038324 [Petrolisthes manimaculis]|uniref:Uncharacterized protein n=1 Tax=Petrolisthes manimaculis TaxID=1843537 RepID=A0AAE1NFZ4_9EUCA|nr:hypothetical protein Pmani_038324 [Petrolisthes manimaculis]
MTLIHILWVCRENDGIEEMAAFNQRYQEVTPMSRFKDVSTHFVPPPPTPDDTPVPLPHTWPLTTRPEKTSLTLPQLPYTE